MITESVPVWERPEVADAQLVLVRAQLDADARGKPPAPFAAFHRAMKFLLAYSAGEVLSIKDIGCGVGHYGILVGRHYPQVKYFGVDISAQMIEHAQESLRPFVEQGVNVWAQQCKSFESAIDPYVNVVFVSQIIEMLDLPMMNFHRVLRNAKKYVLLHRLRLTANDEPTRQVAEPTYCDYPARNVEWNRDDIVETVWKYGEVIYADAWERSLTLIVEKP